MAEENIGKVKLTNVRAAFLHVDEPDSYKGSDPKYRGMFLIDPDSSEGADNLDKLEDVIAEVKYNKWGKKADKTTIKVEKFCLRDGGDVEWDGFEGMMYVSASNKDQPGMFDRANREVEKDGVFYSGCFCDVILNIWAMDNDYGKGVFANLDAIRFRDDGEAFATKGRAKAEDFGDPLDDPEDEFERRRKKRRRGDDADNDNDESKTRRASRSRDDDDESEPRRSRRRSKADDEDDEEATPRRRRRR